MITNAMDFYLPETLNASQPPERRGVRRDHVRLMVMNKKTGTPQHDYFYHLERHLKPGDMLVLNNSRTIPAVLKANWKRRNMTIGEEVEIRLAQRLSHDEWNVLIVSDNVKVGDKFEFTSDLEGIVLTEKEHSPIKTMKFSKSGTALYNRMYSLGDPIHYEYIDGKWPLEYYQTVFANQPGSVEMPSAGRAFSWELLFKLKKQGIKIGFVQLHTGLSYLLDDKWDHSPENSYEAYKVTQETLDDIYQTKNEGGRVIAVGTTVVRTLETVARNRLLTGWTNLYVNKDFSLKLVDGILTGLHEPKASHLEMLLAFIDEDTLFKAYQEAIDRKYLWHEFGDMNLII